jgi:hypothetical protein
MSAPEANTFCDFGLDAEYPVRFRFPVTWRYISAPLDPARAQYSPITPVPVAVTPTLLPAAPDPREAIAALKIAALKKVRESLEAPGSGAQWEMVIPKMERPPRATPARLTAARPQPAERIPTLSTLPQSSWVNALEAVSLKWKLSLVAAVIPIVILIVWSWSRGWSG